MKKVLFLGIVVIVTIIISSVVIWFTKSFVTVKPREITFEESVFTRLFVVGMEIVPDGSCAMINSEIFFKNTDPKSKDKENKTIYLSGSLGTHLGIENHDLYGPDGENYWVKEEIEIFSFQDKQWERNCHNITTPTL